MMNVEIVLLAVETGVLYEEKSVEFLSVTQYWRSNRLSDIC